MQRQKSAPPIIQMATVELLEAEIGSSVAFTRSQMTEMYSKCEEEGEDFLITCNNQRYRVPRLALSAHFQVHPRPEKPMSIQDENEFLRKQLFDLKMSIGNTKGRGEIKETPAEKMVPQHEKEAAKDAEEENIEKILKSIPDDITEVPDAPFIGETPPPRDKGIPASSSRVSDKMSMSEIQEVLKKETLDKKPIKSSDPAPTPSAKKSQSPKAL